MKNLKDSILEKLSIDDVAEPKIFPINKIHDMEYLIEFLKSDDFIEIPYNRGDKWDAVHRKFGKNRGNKVFEYWTNTRVLRFADMTKDISEKNPIFVLTDDFQCIEPKLHDTATINIDMQEFLALIKKVFGWK